jgi:hypothetical protein
MKIQKYRDDRKIQTQHVNRKWSNRQWVCVDLFKFRVDLLDFCVDLWGEKVNAEFGKVNAKIQMRWAFWEQDIWNAD